MKTTSIVILAALLFVGVAMLPGASARMACTSGPCVESQDGYACAWFVGSSIWYGTCVGDDGDGCEFNLTTFGPAHTDNKVCSSPE